MWRSLRHIYIKHSGGCSFRLGQARGISENNEECKQPFASSKAAYEDKTLARSYDLAGAETHFHEGHNLICTLLHDAINQERHKLAKAKGYVGGGERHGNFFCGTLMDEVRLWCTGVVALSSIISCKNLVLDENNRFDISKIPHVLYCLLFPKAPTALAILPVVPSGEPSTSEENSLNKAIASFESQFSECNAATQNKLGVKFAAAREHHKAFALFQRASNNGHPLAQFNLGLCFEHGKGVDKDLNAAAECYKLAASLGHGGALYNLALYHMEGIGGLAKDEAKALELLELAAQSGTWKAQCYLGIYYADESSNHVDYDKAFSYLDQAVAKGDPTAEYYLGVCYERGLGVERNINKAGHLYKSAAKNGNISAQFNMGVFYEHGLGDYDVDRQEALRYYRMAAEAGDDDARHNFIHLSQQMLHASKRQKLDNHGGILMALIQGLNLGGSSGVMSRCSSTPDLNDLNKELPKTHVML